MKLLSKLEKSYNEISDSSAKTTWNYKLTGHSATGWPRKRCQEKIYCFSGGGGGVSGGGGGGGGGGCATALTTKMVMMTMLMYTTNINKTGEIYFVSITP